MITIMTLLLLKNSKIKAKMLKTEVLMKKNHINETYKNTVMPHGRHIYAKSSDMEKETMCEYPHSDHAFPHWKCVFAMLCKMFMC